MPVDSDVQPLKPLKQPPGPWQKYQSAAPSPAGPWTKYAPPTPKPLKLPPGATLLSGSSSPSMKLPPGATLVSGGASAVSTPQESGSWTKYAQPAGGRSKFGGIPVDDSPQQSKFGGIPVEDAPRQSSSKFGGVPIDDTSAWKPVDEASAWKPVPEPNSAAVPDAGAQMRSSVLNGIGATMPQPPAPKPPGMLQTIGQGASDLATGAGQGMISTIHGGGKLLRENGPGLKTLDRLYWKGVGHPEPSEEQWQASMQPQNTLQKVGKFGEQAAEFLIPGAGEEKAAQLATKAIPSASKLIPLIARSGTAAIGSGLVNKAQGGNFGTGALVGGVGGAVGEGLKAVAPAVAESALGIRKADRFYGKTPGRAILDDTAGYRPGTVTDSARDKVRGLTSQVETAAAQSPRLATLAPARTVVNDAIRTAQSENNPRALVQLQPLAHQLSTNVTNGLPLSGNQSATGLLNLKRGFGDAVAWSPETTKSVNAVGKRAYHALDQEFDKAVPGAADMNQRVSSLIPVIKRAESAEHGAGIAQKAIHRVAAHTGAAASGLAGGYSGYREGGIPGALAGGVAGFVIPELLTSPTSQMVVARGLNSPVTHRLVRPLVQGGALTLAAKRAQGSPGSR